MSKNIKMTQKEISIAQGMDRFLRWCRLRGFAEYSIEFYDEIRMNFALFKDLDAPIEDINKELLEEYILFLQKKDITSVTVYTYVRGLKRICNYFIDNDFMLYIIIYPNLYVIIK